jgi:hypothetical protein
MGSVVTRRWGVLDVVFMTVAIGFFVISVGYVYACDLLMK